MSQLANKLAPTGRLRVAVHAADSARRNALSQAVTEAGHIVVDMQDTADVVLADRDAPSGETRPVVALGGADDDLPGVLSRDADASQIDAAIRAVAAGLIVRLPGAADSGFGAVREVEGHALLTPRELEVLAALAEGMTNKAIARRLNISLHTVKFHIESLLRKLGAHSRAEAVAKGLALRRDQMLEL
jgi:DNA-binding NarL/FixJ family response regulator